MKYLCLCYEEEAKVNALPRGDWDAIVREVETYNEELRKKGHLIAAQALQSVQAAKTVRVRNGAVSTTDGPFAETKEQLGGYHLLECKDLDEALQFAQRVPTIRVGGTIEVRPLAFVTK